MKIKDVKLSLSVSMLGKEHLSFKVTEPNNFYSKGLELHFCDNPCGVIVKSGSEEVWVNINNISFMRFFDEVISDKPKKAASPVK